MNNNITGGVIWKQLLLFFFPIWFGTFFQQLYNTADAVIVGNFVGKGALAAVGTTAVVQNLLVGFFVGVASGASVVISQYYGARQGAQGQRAGHTAMAMALLGGVGIMLIGLAASRWALSIMNTPADVMEDAVLYLRICFLGMVPSLIYNMGTGILRAVGDNATLVTSLAKDRGSMKILGLAIGNGCTALSGSILAQQAESASVSIGTGMVVQALAAVIIGEVIFGKIFRNFALKLLAVAIGSIIYYVVIQAVVSLSGINSNYLKLLSAMIVALFLAVPYWKARYLDRPASKGGANHA